VSQSEAKKHGSGRGGSPTSKGGEPVVRRVVLEDGPAKPAPRTPPKPPKPKKDSAAKRRAAKIKAEIEQIMEAGSIKVKYLAEPLVLRPLGAFAEAISEAFARLMDSAESPPVDHFVASVRAEHPDWDAEAVTATAIQRFVRERGRKGVIAAAAVASEGNLMYRLAGLAVRLPEGVEDPQKWAEDTLQPGEAMRIVRAAIELGEVRDYLGESLSILGTEEPDDDEDKSGQEDTPPSSPDESAEPSSDSTTSGPESSSS